MDPFEKAFSETKIFLARASDEWSPVDLDNLGTASSAAYVMLVESRLMEERFAIDAWLETEGPGHAVRLEAVATGRYLPRLAVIVQQNVPGWGDKPVACQPSPTREYRLTIQGAAMQTQIVDDAAAGGNPPTLGNILDALSVQLAPRVNIRVLTSIHALDANVEAATGGESYSPSKLAEKLDLSSPTVNKHARAAGVQTPGRGKRNHRFSEDDAMKICKQVILNGTPEESPPAKALISELQNQK